MPSPEYTSQPHIVFASGSKTGGLPYGPQLESPQQLPLIETALSNQALEALKLHANAALGFLPDRTPADLEGSQSASLGQSLTIDKDQIKAKRQAQFEQTGYIPPIVGGAPKQIDLPVNEILSMYRDNHVPAPEIAQHFGVSLATIYKKLHEADESNLSGTPINKRALKRMDKEDQESFERWLVENKEALEKEQEETREVIRSTFGQEFLEQYEETDKAIKEMIRNREKKQMKK